ncbi:MAG: M14 family metallopeptidase, partial [Bacteroidota bacterium]
KIGESPMGKPMYVAFFSHSDNIQNLDELRKINRELALNHELDNEQQKEYIREGKVFFVATLSMHASEVGPSQSAPLIAHKLLNTQDPDTTGWMEDVVYMMVPSHNPDGMDMIVNHYKGYKGTKYEGSSMPGVYHKYVGHDNNRDFVTLSQEDTRAISKIFSHTWFPQVMVEKHQMGSTGPRYFVPPNHDPIAENVDAGIWNWIGLFGMNMIKDMTRNELAGVSQHYLFDNYWPGSTETCIWKNVIGFLTESASVKYATPIYVEENELSVGGKGLSEYKKSINMPLPWEGGWWRLSDIMDYEVVSTMSAIKSCANHKEDILKFRNDLCNKEVNKGRTQAPYYYIMPEKQHDKSELVDLVNLLEDHGVDRYVLQQPVEIENRRYRAGDVVVPLAQPFRPFIKEVMERQDYPVRHYTPDGEMVKPYDITSWSLPLHRGVECYEIDEKSEALESSIEKLEGQYTINKSLPDNYEAAVFPFSNNESYKAAFLANEMDLPVRYTAQSFTVGNQSIEEGAFVIPCSNADKADINGIIEQLDVPPVVAEEEFDTEALEIGFPKTALVETYQHDMDAGWTRYIFDSYHVPYEVIHPEEIREKELQKYDVLVFPDTHKSVLLNGKYEREDHYRMSNYSPEYTKGMEKEGLQKVMKFIQEGGKIISWGRSTELFMGKQTIQIDDEETEEFSLPVNDVADQVKEKGFYCPGSFVRVKLDNQMVFNRGMPDETGVFYRGNPVFTTNTPIFDMDRRVLSHFPEEDILLSGFAEEEKQVAKKPTSVWIRKGEGEMIIFSFKPQFRASTQSDYKMIFNSLLFSR